MCPQEPDLEQLLADPLIRLMMSSDEVEEHDIRELADLPGVRRRAADQSAFYDRRGCH